MKSTFQIQLGGAPQVNRDAVVTLTHEATGQKLQLKPFLDGSLMVRDVDPGLWQIAVDHPNATVPLFESRVRLFDQKAPTLVPINIRPDVAPPPKATPIADLTPIQQAAASARERIAPLSGKSPGEVIRSSDWNALAAAVIDVAGALGELTTLVAPLGHGHLDIQARLDTLQDQLNKFATSFGRAQLQGQRADQITQIRALVQQVATAGGATAAQTKPVDDALAQLDANVDVDSGTFTSMLTGASSAAFTLVNQLSLTNPNLPAQDSAKELQATAGAYSKGGVATSGADETVLHLGAKASRAASIRK
jgi:hypothetical protein